MAATPQKSDVPVATIGGEQEGRPVVVVPDIEQAEKPKEEHTSIAEGKPEPGRNIFEGEPVKNVKSETPKDPVPPVDHKEISSVITKESKAVSDSSSNSGSSSSDTGTTTSSSGSSDTGSSSSASTSSASQTEVQNDGIQKPAGPLGEAEAEAEKAASELYPDAIKR
jgi:dolichyl-phosphate-mannose-protein mannosyltransferase